MKNFNIWTLEPFDIPIVTPDDPPAVDVVGHPGKVHQGSEHPLEVDVVAKDEPEAEHGLAQTEDGPDDHPWQHEAADVLEDAPDEADGGDDQEGEHEDAEPSRRLGVMMQICFKQWKIKL